jgi:hypothetical protein
VFSAGFRILSAPTPPAWLLLDCVGAFDRVDDLVWDVLIGWDAACVLRGSHERAVMQEMLLRTRSLNHAIALLHQGPFRENGRSEAHSHLLRC